MSVMPKGMQKLKLRDELKRKGISPDLIDLDALIDAKLSYPENISNVMKNLGKNTKAILKSSKTASHRKAVNQLDSMELSFEREQALTKHLSRPLKSIMMDDARRAKTIIRDRDIINNPNILKRWFLYPNRYDIEGIDV